MSTWQEITFPENFHKFVVVILNGCHLIIKEQPYRICETELYYFSQNHPDHYVHKDELQSTFGQVYFHRSGKNYRGGNYKGLDLTFGRPNIMFSILIRTIQNMSTGEVISGPCLVVNHLLTVLGYQTINDLITAAGGTINFLTHNNFIYIQPQKSCTNETILYGPRVGLSDKYSQFKMLPYRFVSEISMKYIKKQKKQLQFFWGISK